MATSIFRPNFPGAEALQQAADTAAFVIGLDLHKKTTAICVIDPRKREEPVFQLFQPRYLLRNPRLRGGLG